MLFKLDSSGEGSELKYCGWEKSESTRFYILTQEAAAAGGADDAYNGIISLL